MKLLFLEFEKPNFLQINVTAFEEYTREFAHLKFQYCKNSVELNDLIDKFKPDVLIHRIDLLDGDKVEFLDNKYPNMKSIHLYGKEDYDFIDKSQNTDDCRYTKYSDHLIDFNDLANHLQIFLYKKSKRINSNIS